MLVGLTDEELLRGASQLVARANELTGDVLAHLVEVEARMLYAELGFPNLFSYCVESLGLSEGAAGRRCRAAGVCRRFPEAFELVATGDLHLSALCGLAAHLQPENAVELFKACRRKSRRQVDEILAVRFPKPDAKESIRRLPCPAAAVSAASPSSVAATVAGATPAEPIPAPAPEVTPKPMYRPRNPEIQSTSADRYKVQFTADARLRELIERACALCPDHSHDGEIANVVARALELFVAQQEKRRFAVGRKPRKARVEAAEKAATGGAGRVTPPGGVKPRRPIKAADRRVVHDRDQGRCAWVSKDGRRCAARARLQFDHVLAGRAKMIQALQAEAHGARANASA